ncbi:MAG: malate synthase A [Nocardioidaceae bacterium]
MTVGSRIQVVGAAPDGAEAILTPDALAFVAKLDSAFAGRRCELLAARCERAKRVTEGSNPDFNPDTTSIRSDPEWRVCAPAPGLLDRRVEITGPPEQRMAVNALNSDAKVWLADLEDAHSPTWTNVVQSQATLLKIVDGTLDFTVPGGKRYVVGPDPATMVVRPRGWHMVDKNVVIDGRPVPAALLDFGLYFYHCAAKQIARGSGPYFYLPKLESALEARLWNDVFVVAQDLLSIPRGTIRATVLIETIFAAFEMEEILFELREHSAGLNAGRWDYLFSIIKAFADRGDDYVLPDRSAVTMTAPFMRAYSQLLVDTCHRRGAHAIGGMSAFIPRADPEENRAALEQVRLDKEREAGDGFDGSWVAHPGLVATCRAAFDAELGAEPHQITSSRSPADVTAEDLLSVAKTPGQVTEAGVRANVGVAVRYVDAWLRGSGAVALNGLMEDAATAEIARCQIWQWLRAGTVTAEGSVVDRPLVVRLLDEETAAAAAEAGVDSRVADARGVFEAVTLSDDLPPFLTTWAYSRLLQPRTT